MRSDHDLLWGEALETARFLGVHVKTVQRWKAGTTPLPEVCRRLLALRFEGDASALMGEQWQGFYFGRDGMFYMPGWRYGFEPRHIKAWHFQVQQVRALERELYALKTDNLGREFVRGLINHALTQPYDLGNSIGLDIGHQRQHTHGTD